MDRATSGVPERFYATRETERSLIVPRGAVDELKSVAAERNYDLSWVDERELGSPITVDDFGPPLRDYQEQAVERAVRRLQGTVILPPGGGKTTIGAAIIGRIGRSALVVVHTDELVDQWCETLRSRLGIQAGRAQRGAVRFGPVTVAIVNTLDDVLIGLPGLARAWGTVIVDECHFAPAAMFQRVIGRLPARYRFGLTATPEREDGLGPLIGWSFGDRLIEVEARDLIRRGFLIAPRVRVVKTNFYFDVGEVSKRRIPSELHTALVSNASRTALIADIASKEAARGERVLVLSNSIEHCEAIASRLNGSAHAVVTSKTKKSERRERVAEFRDGRLPLLLATSLADHGVDWPQLSRVVLALPGSSTARTIQRLGRLMRNYPGKRPELIDVVDELVPILVNRWHSRRRVYRKIDLEVEQ